jgi:hypothetical protein
VTIVVFSETDEPFNGAVSKQVDEVGLYDVDEGAAPLKIRVNLDDVGSRACWGTARRHCQRGSVPFISSLHGKRRTLVVDKLCGAKERSVFRPFHEAVI